MRSTCVSKAPIAPFRLSAAAESDIYHTLSTVYAHSKLPLMHLDSSHWFENRTIQIARDILSSRIPVDRIFLGTSHTKENLVVRYDSRSHENRLSVVLTDFLLLFRQKSPILLHSVDSSVAAFVAESVQLTILILFTPRTVCVSSLLLLKITPGKSQDIEVKFLFSGTSVASQMFQDAHHGKPFAEVSRLLQVLT